MIDEQEREAILYPEIEPYAEGDLPVSEAHTIHFEECGNPHGKPALFLHGGPGSGKAAIWRRLFDAKQYRITLFDQRGCGLSRPYGSLNNNTTNHLLADIEQLRMHLQIDKWLILGGSWGSTLGLAYAQMHPDRVSELILYGIFLGSKREVDWFFRCGASAILPEAWERFVNFIPQDERDDLLNAYHRRLNSDNLQIQLTAAKAWSEWEAQALKLIPDSELISRFTEDEIALAQARIECHYFVNNCFLKENQLINDIDKLRHIPAVLVQGRYDLICPIETAWHLHKSWPEAELIIIANAGHSAREPGIQQALINCTNRFACSENSGASVDEFARYTNP